MIKKGPQPKVKDNNPLGIKKPTVPYTYVTESRHWYKDQYRRSLFVALIALSLLAVSMSMNIILVLKETPPKYFSATPDLRLVEMTPLDQPLVSQGGLLNWASEVVTSTFSLDFLHWRNQLMTSKQNFFDDSFDGVLANMQSSGILTLIKDQRLNLKTVLESAPVITAEGILSGAKSWQIEFPIILSYESSNGVENTQHLIADVLIQRVSTTEHPRGLKVKRLILKNKK